ncbi:Inositol-1-monophosphatase [Phycisphaerae bacterium RAS1]|nr:Inositol-1-monophosphatase [Phycisphaerae bacterium RAS1]
MNAPRPAPNALNAAFLDSLRLLAETAARAGGSVARAAFKTELHARRKADGSEVTDADEAAQAAAIVAVLAQRPGDAIIAEEDIPAPTRRNSSGGTGILPVASGGMGILPVASGGMGILPVPGSDRTGETPVPPGSGETPVPPGSGETPVPPGSFPTPPRRDEGYCWIIDPIDGTRSFLRGVPLYACSVAVMHGGFPVAGAIYWPDLDEMFSARTGGGLLVNAQPAARWSHERAGGAISQKPVAGIPSTSRGPAFDLIHSWVDRVVVRNLGSTALHLALVAEGRMDAALISDSKLWDIAAGWLLVCEAGGAMRRLDGGEVFPIDVATYAGEAIPSLAARDADLLSRLETGT